jgi:hypothetical protein
MSTFVHGPGGVSMIIGIADSHDPKTRRRIVKQMARAAGCTCRPHVAKPKREDDGLLHVNVSHDSWCYLLQRRTARFN